MKSDMTRVLVESTIRRTLKAMRESPEREARNLVDAGAQFSTGRFQTRLISHAQRMLQNAKSAYYALVKDVVTYADHDNITTFGVNLGYNSCTKGARLIRETEREKGFNIPWALHLRVSQEKLASDPGLYPSILREGTSLGIYTYLLFVPGEAQAVLPLVMEYPDCAFLLFLEGGQITPAFLEELAPLKNVMVSVRRGEAMEQACRALRAGIAFRTGWPLSAGVTFRPCSSGFALRACRTLRSDLLVGNALLQFIHLFCGDDITGCPRCRCVSHILTSVFYPTIACPITPDPIRPVSAGGVIPPL